MNWDWLLGFLEGEGAFTISLRKNKYRYSCGYQIIPFFQLNQLFSKGNKLLYDQMQDFLKQNGIKSFIYKIRGSKFFVLTLRIYSIDDCLKFASYLENLEWQTPKKSVFMNWVEAVKVVKSGEYKTPNGLEHILTLRENVQKMREYETDTMYRSSETKQLFANNDVWREWLSKNRDRLDKLYESKSHTSLNNMRR